MTVNTGSSSLKLTPYRVDGESEVAELTATADRIGTPGARLRLDNVRGGVHIRVFGSDVDQVQFRVQL